MQVSLDLTPLVRGPFSSVGLTALRTSQALAEISEAGAALDLVSRDAKISPQVKERLPRQLRWLNPWERLLGRPHAVYHSFELHLPPVWASRRVLTVHDCWTLRENAWQEPSFQRRQRRRLVKALGHAHRIITPTEAVRLQLGSFDKKLLRRTFVVPWGPLLAGNTSLPDVRREGLQILMPAISRYLLQERPFLLLVATLEKRKNHRLALEALASLKNLDLVLVGARGFGFEEVETQISEAREWGLHIERFENVDELSLLALYDRSLGLLCPSFEEGFGLPMLEAMARGKAILASRTPVHEEVGGKAPLYFDPEHGASELREYIEALRDDPYMRRELESRSRQQSEKFSWATTARKCLDVYQF